VDFSSGKSRKHRIAVFRKHRIAVLLFALIFGLSANLNAKTPDVEKGLDSYERAMEFYSAADYGQAKKAIEEAHKHDPRPVYLGFRAWCVFRLGDEAEGLRIMNTLSRSKGFSSEERLDFEAAVSRMRDHAGIANLNFRIEGQEVRVIVNGESKVPESPQYSLSLVPGSHAITFQHGKDEKTHDIYLEANQFMELTYEAPATIKLDKKFKGHILRINDLAVTLDDSMAIQWKAGQSQIKVEKEGLEIIAKNLALSPGQTITLDYPTHQTRPVASTTSSAIGSDRNTWLIPTLMGISGTGLIAGGIYLHDQASTNAKALDQLKPTANNKVYSMSQSEALARYHDSQRQSRSALILYSVGGAALSGAILWALWPNNPIESQATLHFGAESLFIQGHF